MAVDLDGSRRHPGHVRCGAARRGRVFEGDCDVKVNRLVIKSLLVLLVQPNHTRGHASKFCSKSKSKVTTPKAVQCHIDVNGTVLRTTADVITREKFDFVFPRGPSPVRFMLQF